MKIVCVTPQTKELFHVWLHSCADPTTKSWQAARNYMNQNCNKKRLVPKTNLAFSYLNHKAGKQQTKKAVAQHIHLRSKNELMSLSIYMSIQQTKHYKATKTTNSKTVTRILPVTQSEVAFFDSMHNYIPKYVCWNYSRNAKWSVFVKWLKLWSKLCAPTK